MDTVIPGLDTYSWRAFNWNPYADWQLLEDRVLVRRIAKPDGLIKLTDRNKGNGVILAEGIVLAVGPGKWIEGTWWRSPEDDLYGEGTQDVHLTSYGIAYRWHDGYRQTPEVRPGDKVLFNARWNDFAHDELKATGADLSGPLERPLSYKHDPMVHLIQEADIAGKIGPRYVSLDLEDYQ